MASITGVSLDVHTINTKSTVTVKYTLTFLPAEQGQKYGLIFEIFGADPASDVQEGHSDPITLLTTFQFPGALPFVTIPVKPIIAQSGTHQYIESQDVRRKILDEDPASLGGILSPPISHPDEVYAKVTLLIGTAQSPITTLNDPFVL